MDDVARFLAESRASLRWHRSRPWSAIVYPRAFAAFGRGSVLVAPSRLRGTRRITIGSDCACYEGCWLQTESDRSWLEVGDRTYLGQRVHLHAVGRVSIGSDCVIADDVFVSDSEHVPGDLATIASRGDITIGDRVFLGLRSVVLGGVAIGDGAVVGAGSVVTRSVAAGAVVGGVPARVLTSATSRDAAG